MVGAASVLLVIAAQFTLQIEHQRVNQNDTLVHSEIPKTEHQKVNKSGVFVDFELHRLSIRMYPKTPLWDTLESID